MMFERIDEEAVLAAAVEKAEAGKRIRILGAYMAFEGRYADEWTGREGTIVSVRRGVKDWYGGCEIVVQTGDTELLLNASRVEVLS